MTNINKQYLFAKYLLCKQMGGGYKWTTLEHNGVMFPPEYIPHGILFTYNNELIKLSQLAEEAAMLYAKFIGTDYVQNKTFNKNFFNDWKKILGKDSPIQSFELCDFSQYHQKYLEDKELKRKLKSDSESLSNTSNNITILSDKEIVSSDRPIGDLDEIHSQNVLSEISRINSENIPESEKKYKIAHIDGKEQPVGNYRMEPPAIFLGRGDNPNIGKIKKRIYPEDITINIGKEAKVPEIPDFLKDHKWGKIIHDKHVEWLASWPDTITGKQKYMWLGGHSDIKASHDREKFDLARKLKRKIENINAENEKNLFSDNIKLKQVATALYFIDKFALRVGNEKGSDDTDTVGVSTLRVEHINLLDNNTIELDFLGKDSVPYYNKLSVDPIVYKNLQLFIQNKHKNEQIFDKINSTDINKYLQSFLKDLTAKLYRTFNASNLFQKELKKIRKKYEGDKNIDMETLIIEFNKANTAIAEKLNHQKGITKSNKPQIDRIDEQIKKAKSKLRKLKSSGIKNKIDKIEIIRKKIKKLRLKKELKQEGKSLSLGTSKQNYIDPRIIIAFVKEFNIPIEKVFTKTLIEKFKWAMEVDATYRF
jgi:DNA topoisomerase-1